MQKINARKLELSGKYFIQLKFCVANCSWERNNVSDIRHAGKIHNSSFKAEAVACVLSAAVSSEVEIPAVVLLFEAKLFHACGENVEAFFSLATANDFANAGNEAVHSRNGFAIVVETHIKGFYLLWIICYKNRAFEHFLSEVSFVFSEGHCPIQQDTQS